MYIIQILFVHFLCLSIFIFLSLLYNQIKEKDTVILILFLINRI